MNEQELLENIKYFTLKKIPPDDVHGYGHTERVYQMCVEIGHKLGAKLLVLKSAAILHDIGRYSQNLEHPDRNHAEISAEKASNYLDSLNFRFNKIDLSNIIHCIQAHSFSNHIQPKTLEAKILSDVDKLDALGAIGLYRTIGYTTKIDGNLQDVLSHLENKIFKLKNRLFLEISKEYAKERYDILKQFYQGIKKELKLS